MSPNLIWILRRHEYWRLAWASQAKRDNEYSMLVFGVSLRGGREGTAVKMLKRHKYDTYRWSRNPEMMV